MSWIPPASAQPKYGEWDVDDDADWNFLGSTAPDGQPAFYNRRTHAVHRGHVDDEAERLAPEDAPSWELNPEETLGEFLERVGEETGWESLSEFARDQLEDGEGTD